MKCEKCKEEYDSNLVERVYQIMDEKLGDNPRFDGRKFLEKINDCFSHFLRTEYKIDGVEKICGDCYLELYDEFQDDSEKQKVIIEEAIQKLKDDLK